MLFGCFAHPGFIVISFFTGPFMVFVTVWTIKDKTTLEFKDDILIIKEVHRSLSDNWKIHKTNILKFEVIHQNFTNSGHNTSFTGKVMGKWSKKAYSKKVLRIQIRKRVHRIGKDLSENDVDELFHFLKMNLN
jgi:hypothetical protein